MVIVMIFFPPLQNCTNECQDIEDNLEIDSTNELFISPQPKANEEWSLLLATTYPKRIKHYNLSNDHWKQMSKLIPNYKKLSTDQFKDALMKIIPASSQHHIKEYYISLAMLQFIQERTEIICHILQLKIEQDYWNYIDSLTSMSVLIWLFNVDKKVTKQNSINWNHTKSKTNIQHRQTII
ncbi:unnamed protein product [Rotaria sp. Silwood2]|nr:unnamed protein product [Rotaria sp. Silwood2]CAF2940705.1 unnamed protein product [Rotaria sp. Silwood2]CAF3414892.1 unnamed protein product [Rotaria sp. Silwood2]CAF4017247.1 unnamed protein product [Rotaria sp. Silwood2]CAF4334880.1 unnamed protein product [Rotaria sp. Silwood2]